MHHFMDEMRERAPIVPILFMGTPSWLITRYDALEHGFKDTVGLPPHRAYQFGIAPLIGENFQSMEGERHRLYRKLATPTFRPRVVEKIDSTMLEDAANELIDTFIDQPQVDMVKVFTERYPYLVIARLLGIPRDEEEQFSQPGENTLHVIAISVGLERFYNNLNCSCLPEVPDRKSLSQSV